VNYPFLEQLNLVPFGHCVEPLFEPLDELKVFKEFEERMVTVIDVIDLVFQDLNFTVLNQGLNFVDGNASENVKGQRWYQKEENDKDAKGDQVRARQVV